MNGVARSACLRVALLNNFDPSGRQAALPPPSPAQQKACQAACQAARDDPYSYGLGNKIVGFVLCMPQTPSSPPGRLYCACLGAPVVNEYPSVKDCILAHEITHINFGDDVCDPNCPAPYTATTHPPGYNRAASECRAAAAEIACLWKAFSRAPTLREKDRIAFHINRERDYCKRLGGNIDQYLPPGANYPG
jgi:hypothetical protein